MTLKFAVSIFATNLAIALCSSSAIAGCGDRPGTPTNVTANPVFGVFGMVRVEWTNTASEEVWWDYDVTHNGVRVPQRAGMPPRVAAGQVGLRFGNSFSPGYGDSMLSLARADRAWAEGMCVENLLKHSLRKSSLI